MHQTEWMKAYGSEIEHSPSMHEAWFIRHLTLANKQIIRQADLLISCLWCSPVVSHPTKFLQVIKGSMPLASKSFNLCICFKIQAKTIHQTFSYKY